MNCLYVFIIFANAVGLKWRTKCELPGYNGTLLVGSVSLAVVQTTRILYINCLGITHFIHPDSIRPPPSVNAAADDLDYLLFVKMTLPPFKEKLNWNTFGYGVIWRSFKCQGS